MSRQPPMDYTVLGGGITGCATAYFLRSMGARVTLIEKEATLGGIAQSYELGNMVYDFGPHMLHATKANTIDLYQKFDIRQVDYFAKMSYDGTLDALVDFPFSLDTIFQLPREVAKQVIAELYELDPRCHDNTNLQTYLRSINGQTLYRLFNHDYSRKFWGLPPDQVPSNAAARWISFRTTDKRLYPEWQAYPKGGFNQIFHRLTQGIQVLQATVLGMGEIKNGYLQSIRTSIGEVSGKYFISTLPPEVLIGESPARLKYIGKVVVALRLQDGPFHPIGIGGIYFPSERWKFNRIVEYPVMSNEQYPDLPQGTIVTIEYPLPQGRQTGMSETAYIDDAIQSVQALKNSTVLEARFHQHDSIYPFRDLTRMDLYKKYRHRLEGIRNLALTGRYGNFVYVNMNHCIEMAVELVANIFDVSQAEVFQQEAAC